MYGGIILFVGADVCGLLNFAGSWGPKFVGNLFVALQFNTIHYFVKHLWGRKFVDKGSPRNPQTLNPYGQW